MLEVEKECATPAGQPENSFALMPELHRRFPRPGTRWLWAWRLLYRMLASWRWLRIRRWVTALLGPQYRRSRDLIEIDITYQCNLHCQNCNRSVSQAREALHMPVGTISRFVDDSLNSGWRWRRVRVLGGEPTLHPEFRAIVGELLRYKKSNPSTIVEVVTNGHGERVRRELAALPADVMVDNSHKESAIQPLFAPFNLAPIDDPSFARAAFSNGCAILEDCGMGLTPLGYYPCAVAGGIDRILGEELGRATRPDGGDDMLPEVERLCRFCGRFRDGHFVPRVLRPVLEDAPVSRTWRELYAAWSQRREPQRDTDGDAP